MQRIRIVQPLHSTIRFDHSCQVDVKTDVRLVKMSVYLQDPLPTAQHKGPDTVQCLSPPHQGGQRRYGARNPLVDQLQPNWITQAGGEGGGASPPKGGREWQLWPRRDQHWKIGTHSTHSSHSTQSMNPVGYDSQCYPEQSDFPLRLNENRSHCLSR